MVHQLQQELRLAEHEPTPSCAQGHHWQPTIFLGYFQCAHCKKLAACSACVSQVRGKALIGYCQAHQHLRTLETAQEVLG
jgi:hypothetical protein